jgi:hypothetical protein
VQTELVALSRKDGNGGMGTMTDSVPTYFRYWGKADPKYEGQSKWHPLVYHCLDVAAVAINEG